MSFSVDSDFLQSQQCDNIFPYFCSAKLPTIVYCSNSTLQEPKLIKIKMRHFLLLKRFSSYRFLSFSNMMYYYSKGHFPKEILQNFVYGSLWDCTVYTGFGFYTRKFPQTISAKTSHCLRSIKTQN